MTDPEGSFVTNIDGLSAHYAKPTERVLKKRLDHVNAVGRAFIAASPFLVLATGNREGLDCSPKGDRPVEGCSHRQTAPTSMQFWGSRTTNCA